MRSPARCHAAVAAVLLAQVIAVPSPARATDAISFNIARSADYWLDPTQAAGVVPVPNWNDNPQLDSTQPKFSNVIDSNGDVTVCDVDFGTQLNYSYVNNTPTNTPVVTNDQLMMKSAMGTSSTSSHSLSASSVPYERYDIYLYFGGAGSSATTPYNFNARCQTKDQFGAWVTATPTYWIQDSNKSWSGTFQRATATNSVDLVDDDSNYILFEGWTDPTFRIYIESVGRRAGPCGFQIVDSPLPPALTLILVR